MRRILLFCMWSLSVAAQKPRAVFFEDSVTVGKETRMAMSYLHSSKSDIVFPDSSFDFSPFRYVSSELYETRTVEGKSLDSVIYTLVTYDLDSVLFVKPYIRNLRTGETIYADPAKVYLKFSITGENIREPRVKETVNVFRVRKEVNLPKITYYVLGFLALGFLVIAFFGDWLRKKYRLWKFDRTHQRFLSDFRKMAMSPKSLGNNERALKEWKIYLEELENEPVSTMSTSELGKLYENERLESALKMFDSAIFGGVISEDMPLAYRVLQDFSVKRYRQIRKTGIKG
ncbi:hypothetical protein [Leadbetterella sp. DM7]|uniref:hypothetical protein n=1 Tax=Leadbetterella sp. DM7 TaxID=3235085 RepID=UPI00349EC667